MASVVLITGSSSGIGKALCQEFSRRGCRVIATARQLESIADLKEQGMATWPLDVNQPEQVRQTVAEILAAEERLDILINNAGFGQFGPMLDVSPEQMQAQFETNVFAPLFLIQQVAPIMGRQGSGLIVNMGSISGVTSTPFAGAYCASKAALHAYSDALRMELAPFGIRVVTIQPGGIESGFGEVAAENIRLGAESWYGAIADHIQARATLSQQNATPTEEFAEKLVAALLQPQPPAMIRLGKKSFRLPFLKRWLPTFLLDRILKKRFGLNELKEPQKP
ncbi:short-chain dehydrogenase [filamentous cyanobacterium CCP5]|nr:short-chain dehydrogenase [filamentous cyanobacterium CCP5]